MLTGACTQYSCVNRRARYDVRVVYNEYHCTCEREHVNSKGRCR